MKRSVNFQGSRATVARKVLQDPVARGFLEAVQQRDELLAAARNAVSVIEQLVPEPSARGVADVVLAQLRAAIAKAEGK